MGQSMTENFAHLLELIDQQGAVIQKQAEIIARLINETVEKENYIETMLEDY